MYPKFERSDLYLCGGLAALAVTWVVLAMCFMGPQPAEAQGVIPNLTQNEAIFTQSVDGRTLFVWACRHGTWYCRGEYKVGQVPAGVPQIGRPVPQRRR